MSANIDKMSIVIKNYFSAECDVDTTIRQAYERGFRRGASACEALNMHIRELSDECGKLNEENAKLLELCADMVKMLMLACWTSVESDEEASQCIYRAEALGIEVE